jgi:hypothetical protein
MQIEIGRYRGVDKGALRGFFELYVPEFGLKVSDCQHFAKGDQHWFNWPSKELKREDGTKSYFPYLSFNGPFRTTLDNAVKDALKNMQPEPKYAAKTHTPEPESPVQGNPFPVWF